MACPNFSDPKNKELISKIGITEFYNKWLAFDGNIPESIYESKFLNKQSDFKSQMVEFRTKYKQPYQKEISQATADKIISTAKANTKYDLLDIIKMSGKAGTVWLQVNAKPEVYSNTSNDYQTTANTDTINKVKSFLSNAGIKLEVTNSVIDKYGAQAVADSYNKLIQVAEGQEGVLAEEGAHIFTELLPENSPLLENMLRDITKYDIYKQTYNQYKSDPNYQINGKVDFKKIKKEAIGKLIAEYAIKENQGVETNIAKSWWASVLDFFKNLFTNTSNPFVSSASSILNSDISQLTNSDPENSLFYRKIDPTVSYQDQKEIVDSMIYDMYLYLQESVGSIDLINLDESDVSADVIKEMYGAVKEDFLALRSSSTDSEAISLLQSVEVNFDNYYRLAIENFSAINFKINPEIALEQDIENSGDNDYNDKIYAKDALESNLRDTLSKDTKALLSIVPKRNTDGTIAKNKLGLPVFEEFNDLYTYIATQLADSKDLNEMVDKLTYLISTRPSLKYVIDRLRQTPNVNDPYGYKAQNLRNSFFSSMQNHYYDFFTIITGSVYDFDSDSYDTKISTYNTNKRSLNRVLFNEWKQRNTDVRPNKEVIARLNTYLKENFEKLNTGNVEALKGLNQFLSTTGITMNDNAMKMYYDSFVSNNKDGKTTFLSFLKDPEKASILKLVNHFHNGGDIFRQPSHDESSVSYEKPIRELALMQANLVTDYSGASFINGENKQIYAINLNNFTQENFSAIIEDNKVFNDYKSDSFFNNLQILKTIDKGVQTEELKIFNLDTLYNNDKKEGVPFNKLNSNQIEIAKLNLFLNNNNDVNSRSKVTNGWGNFLVPTPADRSQTRIARLQRIQSVNESVLDENNNLKTDSGFYKWLISDIASEFSRIQRETALVNTGIDLLDNYHVKKDSSGKRTSVGNAFFFCNHPYLNKLLYPNGYPSSITEIHSGITKGFDLASPEVFTKINEEFKAIFKQELKHLVDNEIVQSFKSGDVTKIAMKAGTVPSNFNKVLGSNPNAFIQSYIANQIYANNELTKLSIGDIAQYKIDPVKMKFTDANKRSGLPYTPGAKLNVRGADDTLGGIAPTFNVAILADVEKSSKTMEDLSNAISAYNLPQELQESWNKVLSPYTKSGAMNIADAQGFCTLQRYAQIMDGQGKLTPAIQESINRLAKNQGTQADVETVLNPIKGFYFGNLNKDNRLVKVNLKYSLVPIIPQLLSDDNVLKQWIVESPLVDEFVFESGVKAGIHKINNATDGKLKYVTLNNKDYRIPQVVPYKDKTAINFGSQIMKLIELNNDNDELKAVYQNLLNTSIKEGYQAVVEKMSNLDDVVRWLQEQLKSSNRTLPDMVEEAVQIVKFRDSGGNESFDTQLSLSYPSIKRTIEAIFLSGFRNDINKLKTPGASAVQVSSFGLFGTDNTLAFVQPKFDNKGNLTEISPAEVVVSPQYFLNILKKKGINTSLILNSDGTIDETRISDELRNIIIYRIPTQGKNSMLPCRIKAFSHPSSGSIIYLPNEVVVQAGSDFDIDKVYIEMIPATVTENGELVSDNEASIENQIFDAHYKFITYPTIENYHELITPNSSDLLKEYRTNLSKYNKKGGVNYWFIPSVQEDLRQKNKAGKELIGIWSQYSTNIPFRQNIKATLTTPILALGREFTSLHNKTSIENNLISEEIAQIQTGAVDNAKDPVLGDLNFNTFTSDMANLLISAGVGLEFTTNLINTPVIKQLTALFDKYDAKGTGALQKAVTEVLKDYGYKGSPLLKDLTKGFNLNLSNELVIQALDNSRDSQVQLNILRWFFANKTNASALNSFIQSSQTNGGLKGSISDGQVFANSYVANVFENKNIEFDVAKLEAHSIHTFYTHGIQKPLNEIIPQYFIDTTPLVDYMVKGFADGNADIANKLKMDFVTYIHSKKGSWFGDQLTSTKVESLLKGPNSIARKFVSFYNNELAKEKESGNKYSIPAIFRLFSTDFNVKGIDLLKFNNTVSKSLDSATQSQLADEFWELYATGNEDTKEFVKDIILNNFLLHGFQSSPDSMIKFIHTKFFVEFGLNTFFKANEELLRSNIDLTSLLEHYNINDFKDRFYVNNLEALVSAGKINEYNSVSTFEKAKGTFGIIGGKLYKLNEAEQAIAVELPITNNYLNVIDAQYTDNITLSDWKQEKNIC